MVLRRCCASAVIICSSTGIRSRVWPCTARGLSASRGRLPMGKDSSVRTSHSSGLLGTVVDPPEKRFISMGGPWAVGGRGVGPVGIVEVVGLVGGGALAVGAV
eukprot:13475202-Alexandrium_andersonii.AAC.1